MDEFECVPGTSSEITPDDVRETGEEPGRLKNWWKSSGNVVKRTANILSIKQETKNKLWNTWNNVKYSNKWMSNCSKEYKTGRCIYLLGELHFPAEREYGFEGFVSDYLSKIWITYRTGMPPFCNSEKTTDCGWGCMLRTTQMIFAQAIVVQRLGRTWRSHHISMNPEDSGDDFSYKLNDPPHHLDILALFEDCPSSPLGIHNLIRIATESIGESAIGRWYAPSEAVSLMRRAIKETTSTSDLSVLLSVDGLIKKTDCEVLSKNWTKSLIIMVTLRMGTTAMNEEYAPHITQLFLSPMCLGIIGGKPERSLYFIGVYGEEVIYLDPHVAREYMPFSCSSSLQTCISQFHCRNLSKIPISEMDPSCVVGFLVNNEQEFHETFNQLNKDQVIDIDLGLHEGTKRTALPLFTVLMSDQPSHSYESTGSTESEKAEVLEQGFELL